MTPASQTLDPAPAIAPAASREAHLRAWAARLGWLLLPLACHFGFSWIGFNPTDDGWSQAVARRMADGEVPHRDFIFVRPALSALLQVPLVWWGGEHVIWLSRLWGWLTIGAVCWIWSGRVLSAGAPHPLLTRFALYATAVPLCAHTFPVMAWHSIDGMLFSSLAVLLAARGTPWSWRAAFVVAGMGALCRQNFAFFPPLLLLATGGRVRDWFVAGFCSALPSLLYFAVIAAAGGARDYFVQVFATGGAFRSVAVMRWVQDPGFLSAAIAGIVVAWLLAGAALARHAAGRFLPALVLAAAGGYLARGMWIHPGAFHEATSVVFGFVLGVAVPALLRGAGAADRLTLVAGLGLTWVTAISIGYNSAALMSGVCLLLLWRLLHRLVPAPGGTLPGVLPVLLAALVAIALGFSHARQQYPYRDRPVDELKWDAGEVLPGATGLRTNALNQATLAELRALVARSEGEGRTYAVLTDLAAHWILSQQRNPLPCEWPQETELGYSPELFRRFFRDLRALPPGAYIIVQKHLISDFNWRLAPVPPDASYYYVQAWVSQNCRVMGESQYFTVYFSPATPP